MNGQSAEDGMAYISISDELFHRTEITLLEMAGMRVSTFRYPSGIAAVRLTGPRSEIVVLPCFGHQIWRASFDGRDVTMGSMFEEPVVTSRFLETYGAFFIHCGLMGIGSPGPDDSHPLHGELPLGRFENPRICVEPAKGRIELTGTFRYRVAFSTNYEAVSSIAFFADQAAIEVSLEVQNKRQADQEILYLAHANFRPVDGGRLDCTAQYTPKGMAVRRSIPSHISPPPGYEAFIEDLAENPAKSNILDPALPFDPEVVFSLKMIADEKGWAHATQTHPDGSADFISYKADSLPMATRWICRTADQQGLGMCMPSTSGVEGYTVEKAHGRISTIQGGGKWRAKMRMGRLDADEANRMLVHINNVSGRS